MKIAVIVPVYNEERYIGACLDSLIKQKTPADEIIVVNNNSTDRSVMIAKRYPVRVINEKKQGMISARNKGFNATSFDIIARTDADTILPPTWIGKIKKSFLDKNLVALSGPAEFYDLPELIQNSRWQSKQTLVKIIKSYNHIVKKMTKHDCVYGPNYSIRNSAWKKIRNQVCLNDKQVHEDLDIAIHLAPLGKIKFDNNLIVKTSSRRWRRADAYLEYLYRGLKSIQKHKKSIVKQKSKQLVKKILSKAFQESSATSLELNMMKLGRKLSINRSKLKSLQQKIDKL